MTTQPACNQPTTVFLKCNIFKFKNLNSNSHYLTVVFQIIIHRALQTHDYSSLLC